MSDCLTQSEIVKKTGRMKPGAQERALEKLGYIVIGRNARGEVQCLARHPRDPLLHIESARGDTVRLNL